MSNRHTFKKGLRDGIPICLGYIPVSFAFGITTIVMGVPGWTAILVSLSNLTSAGQYAGVEMIAEKCAYFELALTVFVINLRYMLMSLAVSQKLEPGIPAWQKMIFGFGITDETFVMASIQKGRLNTSYMLGLIALPIFGWNFGTIAGVIASGLLPGNLQSALGIALYAMFIAIIIPPAAENPKVMIIAGIAIAISCIMFYTPVLSGVSSGMRVIIASVIAAAAGAYFFPRKEVSIS